jgi:hypothetical protein
MNQPHAAESGDHCQQAALERWSRIGLGIRLAYNPLRTSVLPVYLSLTQQLARRRCAPESWLQVRALRLLLQTANDPALPWPWRAVCLEYTAYPLARVCSLLRHQQPQAVLAWQLEVAMTQASLPCTPGSHTTPITAAAAIARARAGLR